LDSNYSNINYNDQDLFFILIHLILISMMYLIILPSKLSVISHFIHLVVYSFNLSLSIILTIIVFKTYE